MTPFRRQPPPAFWADKASTWEQGQLKTDYPLRLQHRKKDLATWFHETVRPAGDPELCAYCDGSLGETSRATIDHFYPSSVARRLALSWENLYPACDRCNSSYKRDQWSCRLVRPDVDPVEELFDFDPVTGNVRPTPGLNAETKARVRLTIRVFRLNHPHRSKARLDVVRNVSNAIKHPPDEDAIEAFVNARPYRFVARRMLLAWREAE